MKVRPGFWWIVGVVVVVVLVVIAAKVEEKSKLEPVEATAGPVAVRLLELAERVSGQLPAEVLAISRQGMEEVVRSGITNQALSTGDTMPGFVLANADGEKISAESLLERGPLVIVFYRGEWCAFCNLYLSAIQDYLPEIESLGATLVGISGEEGKYSFELEQRHNLGFELLSDPGFEVARNFRIAYEVPKVVTEIMRSGGFEFEEHYGTQGAILPLTATYVVDRTGMIVYAFLDADYQKRAEPADVVEILSKIS